MHTLFSEHLFFTCKWQHNQIPLVFVRFRFRPFVKPNKLLNDDNSVLLFRVPALNGGSANLSDSFMILRSTFRQVLTQ